MKLTATILILGLSLLTACGGPPEEKQQTASAGLFLEDSQYGVVKGGVFSKWFAEGIQGAVVTMGPYVDTTGLRGLFEFREIPLGTYLVVVSANKFQTITIDSFEVSSPYPKKLHIAMQLSMDYIRRNEFLSQIYDNGVARAQENYERGKVMIRGSLKWPLPRQENLYVDTIDTWLPMTGVKEIQDVAGDGNLAAITGWNCSLMKLDSLGLLEEYKYDGWEDIKFTYWRPESNTQPSVDKRNFSPDSVWELVHDEYALVIKSEDTSHMLRGAFNQATLDWRNPDHPWVRWEWGPPGSNRGRWVTGFSALLGHEQGKVYDLKTGHIIREWPAYP